MTLPADPVWLITGCSTGFGRELARLVLDRGWRLVATARNVEQVRDLAEGAQGRAIAVALDVTKPDEVASAVKAATDAFGRVDVLVNNAGYGYLSAVEEGEDEQIRAMFEANVFGLAAVTRAVLPVMRGQGSGAIVNITSVGGLVGFPGSGYYAATKFAVEGLTDALSKEVAPLGLQVLAVEPGPFRTDWAGRSLKVPAHAIDAYKDTAVARRAQTQGYSGKQPGDPVRAAEAIITAVCADNPPKRLVLGKFGVDAVREKLRGVLAEMDVWEATSLGADFPEGEG